MIFYALVLAGLTVFAAYENKTVEGAVFLIGMFIILALDDILKELKKHHD